MRPLFETYHLVLRSLRESSRQPAVEIGNIFIPMFFFAVTVGAIGQVAGRAFGVTNYLGFQMPVAILQAVGAGSAGLGMVTDIERGYFDKLLLTPASRVSLVASRLIADGIRIMVLALLITCVGLIFGTGMASGPAGVVVLMLMGGLFGLVYSGIGMAIALKTGSAQAAQLGFLIFFPLLFLSPAFAPKAVFSPWLETVATVNPVTYILEGMRGLVLSGWDGQALVEAFGAIAALGVFTMSLAFAALRSRTA
ncbi:MAG TPA: ABC transporter permease [Dehalococcoidia bacterium]|nr:ABC transporter permease [Dehalococcoidia bacterium]